MGPSENQRKRRLALVIAISCAAGLLFSEPAAAQIRAQLVLPRPKEYPIYTAIGASDDHNCTVVGSYIGSNAIPWVERTTDGGLTWSRQTLSLPDSEHPGGSHIVSVYCIDSLNVLLLGDTGLILRTTDGGQRWMDQTIQRARGTMFASFLDSADGVITQAPGFLFRTSDGGNTWQQLPSLPSGAFYSPKLLSTDSLLCYRYGIGPVFRISQNGSKIDSASLILPAIYTDSGYYVVGEVLWSDSSGYGVGVGNFADTSGNVRPIVAKTTDAGIHWNMALNQRTSLTRYNGAGAAALPSGTVILTGDFGSVEWTPGIWHSRPWIQDSVVASVDFSRIAQIALLDSDRALAILDDGGRGGGPFNAWVARISLNGSAIVASFKPTGSSLQLFPNPAVRAIKVEGCVIKGMRISVFDPLGRCYSVPISGNTLDVSALPSGVYFIVDGNSRAQFVKE